MAGRVAYLTMADPGNFVTDYELSEPSLYLCMDSGAAERFAAAFDAHLRA